MILLDTSGLLAAIAATERRHQECLRVLSTATPPRILSLFVLAELDYYSLKYGGVDPELLLLGEVASGAYQLASFDRDDVGRAMEVIEQYRDLRIGLADASIVVLAEQHDVHDILTLDERHFRALRSRRGRFRILPADA